MSKILFLWLAFSALLLSATYSSAQSTTANQDFENANTAGSLSFAFAGGQYFTGNSGSAFAGPNPSPNNSPVSTSGSRSFGAQNNTGSGLVSTTLDFRNVSFTNFTNNTVSFRLAVFATNQNGGLASNGNVLVSVSTNGGASYSTALTIQGSGNGRDIIWDFSATGVATAVVGSPTTFTAGTTAATKYSTVRLTLPATATQVKVRIVVNANDKTAIALDDVLVSSAGPLPVTLTRFAATRQEQNVTVTWATAAELQNAYFEVQRSTDGIHFAALGQVAGNGTTNTGATYSFLDQQPLSAVAYYRLKQVDSDGTNAFSSVVTVAGRKLSASLYPNPSSQYISLPVTGSLVQYRVYSSTGQTVAAGEAQGDATVDLQRVPIGIYFLELAAEGQRNVQRFVRQ